MGRGFSSVLPLLRMLSFRHIDWILVAAVIPILGAGLLTMNSFSGEAGFFDRQLVWIAISSVFFLIASQIDWRFLKRSDVLVGLYALSCIVLLALFAVGQVHKGAQAWFSFGGFSFQPSDPVQLLVILILAKYFTRRHIEIANFRHIIISGIYTFIPFALILIQPDMGQAMMIFFIWLGMVIVSGIPKRYLAALFLIGIAAFTMLWFYGLKEYQKHRLITFVNPLLDIRGSGYHAYQSMIAVGSGELFGKGVGYGTQSRLKFLPEYQTDFVFAAYAEEWGFFGVLILFALYGIVIWRILDTAMLGATNFETLYACGLAVYFMVHFIVNVGMNIGVMPVTGVTIPFMSYGGSHLLTEFIGLGILMGMRAYRRPTHRDNIHNELIGV
jgi:rod shape determining protein RodA